MNKPLSILILSLILLSACQPQAASPLIPTAVSTEKVSPSATSAPDTTSEVDISQVATNTNTPASASTQTPVLTKPAPTPVIPDQPVVGIHVIHLTSQDELSLFENAGSYWTRFDGFHWDLLEPVNKANPTYKWGKVDEAALKDAADAGAQIIGIVLFAPDWAQKYPGVACGPFAEAALDKFARFMNALVSRYSQPPYNIKYWEIGNEPDVDHGFVDPHSGFGCWGEQSDPYYGGGYYAEMLKAAYGQIKKADPGSKLLVGGLLLNCDPVNPPETALNSGQYMDCTPSRFLEGILKNGGGDYFDGISFHAYDYYPYSLGQYVNPNWHSSWDVTGPVLTAKTRYIRSILAAYGHGDKFLMNTEVALLCGHDGTEPECRSEDFALTKAYYVAEANAAALAQGLYANVWYSLTGWRASGLVDGSLKPYPAYDADKFSAAQLKNAAFVSEVAGFQGVKGYEFNVDGKRMWLLWSLDGDSHTIQLTSLPTSMYDVFGAALPPQKSLTVTLAPVYLEWEP
jgi:hypothetical protein